MKCPWVYGAKQNLVKYHDKIWCKEIHDENEMFRRLCLLIFQCGLKWQMILDKQEVLERIFYHFNPEKIASIAICDTYFTEYVTGSINNRKKIRAIIHNAETLIKLHEQGIYLKDLVWDCSNHRVIDHHWQHAEEIPNQTELSKQLTKKLRMAGFHFIGPKNMYVYLQMVGVLNDHLIYCESR